MSLATVHSSLRLWSPAITDYCDNNTIKYLDMIMLIPIIVYDWNCNMLLN